MAQSEESITLMTPYGVLSIYLLTVADPSRSFRMTFNVSLTMTPYTIRSHSEWTQECLVGKTGNSNMTRSEESMTLMTPYHPSSFRAGGKNAL